MTRDPWRAVLDEAGDLRARAAAALGLPALDVPWEEPPEGLGDLAFGCFLHAKEAREPPDAIASRMAGAFPRGRLIAGAEATGGYVNLRTDPAAVTVETLLAVREAGEAYGASPPRPERVLLEHTSVNPTGPIHVGRARNPIIGDSLARILRRAGYPVTTEYLVNDVGKQMVLLYWGVHHLRPEDVPPAAREKEDHRLLPFYVKVNELAEADPAVGREVEALIRRFEGGDADLTRDIRRVSERVLGGILETLARIGIRFDRFFWESDLVLEGKTRPVIERLASLPQTRIEDGAYYIDMAPFGVMGRDTRWFLTKGDGTSLYPTRDVAYHLDKLARCDLAITVLGENHRLEFRQLSAALSLLGAGGVEAVFYSYVGLPEGGMSTRRGWIVTMDDLVDEAVARALEEVRKRRPDLPEDRMREIAETVGVAALRYNILRVQAEKKITFRWEEALNFEGNSAPFLQYAHARACGILDKAGAFEPGDPALLAHPQEQALARLLAKFPSTVLAAADARRPHVLATYTYDVAARFNLFYRDCPVLTAEPALRDARLGLADAARIVLRNGLDCLGLPAPREM
ncbi:MAG: arginine--tRNA ligase [Euryarchaeota archaeon RBG_16_68_12]|nr:MAG: arginine--tRNA ligase [Euryarchaeota archaeon RBG_16_68_12]